MECIIEFYHVSEMRKPGSRRCVDYTEAELKKCLDVARSNLMTQREAAAKYNITWSTITIGYDIFSIDIKCYQVAWSITYKKSKNSSFGR